MIDGPPKVMLLTVDLHENLVHVPLPFRECAQLLDSLSAYLRSKHRTEAVPPIADGFVTDIDTTLVKEIFDIPQRKWKPDVQHHRQADDLGTGFEVLEGGRFGHSQMLCNRPARLKLVSSDKTLEW